MGLDKRPDSPQKYPWRAGAVPIPVGGAPLNTALSSGSSQLLLLDIITSGMPYLNDWRTIAR